MSKKDWPSLGRFPGEEGIWGFFHRTIYINNDSTQLPGYDYLFALFYILLTWYFWEITEIRSDFLPWVGLTIAFFFFVLNCHTCSTLKLPGQGLNQPMPQPGQHWIRAASVTYAIACSSARYLTHWARQGIKPHPYRHYVVFLTHWATTGTTPYSCVCVCVCVCVCLPFLGPHLWHMEDPRIGV